MRVSGHPHAGVEVALSLRWRQMRFTLHPHHHHDVVARNGSCILTCTARGKSLLARACAFECILLLRVGSGGFGLGFIPTSPYQRTAVVVIVLPWGANRTHRRPNSIGGRREVKVVQG